MEVYAANPDKFADFKRDHGVMLDSRAMKYIDQPHLLADHLIQNAIRSFEDAKK